MEVRKPIRDIDEFNHRKSKDHRLTPPISTLAFGFKHAAAFHRCHHLSLLMCLMYELFVLFPLKTNSLEWIDNA